MKVGILAVQGGFEAHGKMLESLSAEYVYVTQPGHLQGLTGLILPGGESTTMLQFLENKGFLEAIKKFAYRGHCIFGTCAGGILLARKVTAPVQKSLNLLDVTIERNAYGRQLASHFGWGSFKQQPLKMAFIRAPRLLKVGNSVEVFATYQDEPVGIIQKNIMLTTFHPELTMDLTIHQLFIDTCKSSLAAK